MSEPDKVIIWIERILFAARWLMLPIYLAMTLLLGMIVVFFLLELAHALPLLGQMNDKSLVVLMLGLIDLSLGASLVLLVILSGYENFISRIRLANDDYRPEWLSKIDFSGLKLKVLGSITVIGAIHLLGVFFNPGEKDDRTLGWQVLIVVVFALLGLIFALTDKIGNNNNH